MIANHTIAQGTRYTAPEGIGYLKVAAFSTLQNLSAETFSCLVCLALINTNRFDAVWNHNWLSQRAEDKTPGAYHTRKVVTVTAEGRTRLVAPEGETDMSWELLPGAVRYPVPPGHPETRFRSFESAIDGAYEFVRVVTTSGQWVELWTAAQKGFEAFGKVLLQDKRYSGTSIAQLREYYSLAYSQFKREQRPPLTFGELEFEAERNRWVLPVVFGGV